MKSLGVEISIHYNSYENKRKSGCCVKVGVGGVVGVITLFAMAIWLNELFSVFVGNK